MSSKELIIVGGPNGAGKTTFALQYVALHKLQFLSADAIAAEIAPENPASAKIAAGREFLKRLELAIHSDQSLVVESTLSGRSLVEFLKIAKSNGFAIAIIFVFVQTTDTCLYRVRERAKKGGHDVPESDVRRRFHRSILNFWNLYRALADEWMLVYNAGSKPIYVAVCENDQVEVFDDAQFVLFRQLVASR
ncbi:MAG: AAA family ATPase [Bythopirellula sp.]|nr:AAA family ATPase [Bythopirellula sp.]